MTHVIYGKRCTHSPRPGAGLCKALLSKERPQRAARQHPLLESSREKAQKWSWQRGVCACPTDGCGEPESTKILLFIQQPPMSLLVYSNPMAPA